MHPSVEAMYGDDAYNSCVLDTPNWRCMVPVQIWDTHVVTTARRERNAPRALSSRSVTVAIATPERGGRRGSP